MNGGGRFLATAAVLALAGCGGSDARLDIRSTPTPLSATSRPVPHRIAEAHGHLALGNVALAIESFRKALREQPDSVDAMVGLAASYDLMTRFDLSRRYYESALAVVPADTRVLNAFARSLDVQGRSVEAAAVRSEIRTRLAAAEPLAPAIQALERQQTVAQAPLPMAAPSVTIKLPPPRPAATVAAQRPAEPPASASALLAKPKPQVAVVSAPIPVALKPFERKAAATPGPAPVMSAGKPEPTEAPSAAAVVQKPVEAKKKASPPPPAPAIVADNVVPTKPVVQLRPAAPVIVAIGPAAVNTPPPGPAAPVPDVVKSIEVKAPVPMLAQPVRATSTPVAPKAAPAVTAPASIVARQKPVELAVGPPPMPAALIAIQPLDAPPVSPKPDPVTLAQETPPAPLPNMHAGPRLERLSLGEVALITTDRPQWRTEVVSRTAQSTTVRFVPLRKTDARPVIRLLNAARHEGLAARTRRLLVQRGWRQLAIGNARHVRQSSLVLYPASQRVLAKRLAAQFGIALAENGDGTDLIVLLGRDAARQSPARGG